MRWLEQLTRFRDRFGLAGVDHQHLRSDPRGHGRVQSALKHAFAVDPPGPAEPTPEQRAVVDKVCLELFLEMSQPLNFLGAQSLHFLSPALSVLTQNEAHTHFASFLEQRGSVEYFCRRIQEMERQALSREGTADSPKNQGNSDQADSSRSVDDATSANETIS